MWSSHTLHTFLILLTLTVTTLTASTSSPPTNSNNDRITTSQILTIAPKSSTCQNAPIPSECATATQATDPLNRSFEKYKITDIAEQAAVLGLIVYESEAFRYDRNHFPPPGTPGQGTRNMQSPHYNTLYASSIPSLTQTLRETNGNVSQILDLLVSNPDWDFGSGAWFLVSQCDEQTRRNLRMGGVDGWKGYIEGCVGTSVNPRRRRVWERAVRVLKHGSGDVGADADAGAGC